jgi:glycosyltransferase involved in cell wall biosynthesis
MQQKYVLDMSQAAINRTAMYTISLDTLAGLPGRFAGVQYFGKPFKGRLGPDKVANIDGSLLGPLLSDPDRFATEERERSGPLARYPRLFLDPLYVLFDELRADDHVMVLDLSTVTRPEWHSPQVARAYEHAFDRISAVRPRVSAISQNTADTLMINYAYPPDRTKVVPLYVPAVRDRLAATDRSSSAKVRPYVLFVGSLEVRKNLIGAIKAFEQSGLGDNGYNLLIVGGHGHRADQIMAYAETVRGVQFAGFLTDEELRDAYANASAFLYPSYLEGFGVPLLEAMAHGVPCVASNAGACPEVGGDLVRYFDPDDHQSFADELQILVHRGHDERREFANAAQKWIDQNYRLENYLRALDQQLV